VIVVIQGGSKRPGAIRFRPNSSGKSRKIVRMKRAGMAIVLFAAFLPLSCSRKGAAGALAAKGPSKGAEYRIFIVMDAESAKMAEVRAGIVENLDAFLAKAGAKASYESLPTRLDPAAADAIKDRIEAERPDLVFSINNPAGFADSRIASKLKGGKARFVSENVVPVETGVIESWAKPGGKVCGVGVFVQLNSSLRLLRKVVPGVRKIYSYSWDRVAPLNAWWEAELRRACAEEGFEFADFALLSSHQEEMAYAERHAAARGDMAVMSCVSPYVNADGSLLDPAIAAKDNAAYLRRRFMNPFIAYEDSLVRDGALLGACVIWKDLGAQMAELGARVLSGEDPGSIPWEYPRKFNVVINKKTAERLGIAIPPDVMNAACRVYTDYEGGFMGKAE
jgi:putative ABC transport system substrate-binding protein